MAVSQDIRHKVVVRKLPPSISAEEVQGAIDQICQGKYDWFAFVPGKVSLKRVKHSRAYLNFLDGSEVLKFRAHFSGHAFVNKKGAQYKCTVEYAPYQKVPRDKAKEDPREGTYENDADFVAFKQQAEADLEILPSAEAQLELKEQQKKAQAETASKPKVTPLMQFLHDKHSLKPEKKAPILVPIKKKSNKPSADLDLPPHLLNQPATSAQTASAKPTAAASSSRPSSSKPTVLPIPLSTQNQAAPSSRGRKAADHSGKARAEEEPAAFSRADTPSKKGKAQRPDSLPASSRSGAASPAPAVVQRVVPIKLDRAPKPAAAQAAHGATAAGDATSSQAQQAATAAAAQEPDKPGKKVRPGFQTWAPRRGGRGGEEASPEQAGPPGVHALSAAKAAAAAALRAEDRAAGRQASAQPSQTSSGPSDPRLPDPAGWDVVQAPISGWDDPLPQAKATAERGRGRGRGSNPRGRAAPVVQHRAELASDRHAASGSDSAAQPEQDGWGDPLPSDAPVLQTGAGLRQNEPRSRGRGRGRGRGGGRGPDRQSGLTDVGPPADQPALLQPGQQAAAPPRTVLIKKRPTSEG